MATPVSPSTLNDDERIDDMSAPGKTPSGTSPSTFNLEDFLQRNRQIVTVVGVVLFLAIAGIVYWRAYELPRQNAEALDQMTVAVRNFERDSFNLAIKGTGQYPGLEQLVDDYSGTQAGNLSRYYLGLSYLKTGKYAEGVEQLEAFDKPETMVAATAHGAIGYGYEELKDFGKAAASYHKASQVMENGQSTPYYLSQAARCYEAAGETSTALELWQRIETQYPNSQEAQVAPREAARLAASGGR